MTRIKHLFRLSLATICIASFTSYLYAGTMKVCPGSGEKCNATINWGGNTITVTSEKNVGAGTIEIAE